MWELLLERDVLLTIVIIIVFGAFLLLAKITY